VRCRVTGCPGLPLLQLGCELRLCLLQLPARAARVVQGGTGGVRSVWPHPRMARHGPARRALRRAVCPPFQQHT
jgi:hypothetical protein